MAAKNKNDKTFQHYSKYCSSHSNPPMINSQQKCSQHNNNIGFTNHKVPQKNYGSSTSYMEELDHDLNNTTPNDNTNPSEWFVMNFVN